MRWGPSQSEQEEADRPRRGVSPRQGAPCSAAVTAVGEQRHRILSRDGEAARRILVPQIDFTLLSPSGRYESFPDSALSRPTTHSDRVRIEGGRPLPRTKNLLGRWKSRKEGGPIEIRLRISETGAENALPRPLEQSFSRLTRASAALILGPVLQPQYSLSRKL